MMTLNNCGGHWRTLMKGISKSAVLYVLCLTLPGCGSSQGLPLANVVGTVTKDGQPVIGASVEFEPSSGRPSVGTTDERGCYELFYLAGKKGALIGNCVVRITSGVIPVPSQGPESKSPPPVVHPFTIAETVKVKPGKNTFDFQLDQRQAKR